MKMNSTSRDAATAPDRLLIQQVQVLYSITKKYKQRLDTLRLRNTVG